MIHRVLSPLKGHTFVAGLALCALTACGEDDDGPSAPAREIPAAPSLTYDEGHFSAAQRGVALDEEDLFAINAGTSVTLDELQRGFGLLVLNRPYVDSPVVGADGNSCNLGGDIDEALPPARAQAIIDDLSQAGLSYDRIAVNVELMRPDRGGLLWECYTNGTQVPRFGRSEHRNNLIAMFEELADLDGVAYITVGVGINQYYHQNNESGSLKDDYSNFMTLYREIYTAIKARNPDVKVGPGVSWAWFMNTTVPEVRQELEDLYSGEISEAEAVYVAWGRTIAPMLEITRRISGEQQTERYADYLGVDMVPFPNQAPFQGNPAPEDEAAVLAHYSWLELAADGLPLAVPQIDWPSSGRSGVNRKGPFLETIKQAISPFEVEYVAWRRFADLDTTELPGRSSICETFTDRGYPQDFCFSGLLGSSADARTPDVLDILLTDP